MSDLMLDLGIYSLVSLSMACLCMAPLTLVVMVMMGLVFHPLLCRVLINGVIFHVFSGEGLFWGSIMAVCEFDKLDCAWGGGDHGMQ